MKYLGLAFKWVGIILRIIPHIERLYPQIIAIIEEGGSERVALAPHIPDLVLDILTAEKEHPKANKGYIKHDDVMAKLSARVKVDGAFDKLKNRAVMNVANATIKSVVEKFKVSGLFQKGGAK